MLAVFAVGNCCQDFSVFSQQKKGEDMPHTSLETKSEKEIHKYFPKWLEMKQCIQKTYEVLSTHGFNNTNTIPWYAKKYSIIFFLV